MTRLARLIAMIACATALSATSCASGLPKATILIHYSHFTPELVTAHAGVPIAIRLRNDDPIEHEWIVGTEEVHQRHRTGTEPFHSQIPTEVTIEPFSTRVTTVTFDQPGDYKYICHLPGHEAYGMVGTLHVIPS